MSQWVIHAEELRAVSGILHAIADQTPDPHGEALSRASEILRLFAQTDAMRASRSLQTALDEFRSRPTEPQGHHYAAGPVNRLISRLEQWIESEVVDVVRCEANMRLAQEGHRVEARKRAGCEEQARLAHLDWCNEVTENCQLRADVAVLRARLGEL